MGAHLFRYSKNDSGTSQLNYQASDGDYYSSFDGLRAIAIILVFLYHFNSAVFSLGWIGVDLFFVLSGFLITSIILKSVNRAGFFKNFYARRALRIFPLYYLIVFVFLVLLPYFIREQMADALVRLRPWYVFYLQNIYPGLAIGTHPGYLNHLWTLAIEEQFYILWPLIVYFTFKNVKQLILVTLSGIVLALLLRIVLARLNVSYVFMLTFTFTRMDSLLIGALFAILYYTGNANWIVLKLKYLIGVAVVSFALFLCLYWLQIAKPLTETFLNISLGLVIFYLFYHDLTKSPTIISNVLQARVLQYIGKWSYGFYVWHYPIILICRPTVNKMLKSLPLAIADAAACIVLLVITILISAASYNLFEKRFLMLKAKFDYKPA